MLEANQIDEITAAILGMRWIREHDRSGNLRYLNYVGDGAGMLGWVDVAKRRDGMYTAYCFRHSLKQFDTIEEAKAWVQNPET